MAIRMIGKPEKIQEVTLDIDLDPVQASSVRRLDNVIHWINRYLLDSDLSGR